MDWGGTGKECGRSLTTCRNGIFGFLVLASYDDQVCLRTLAIPSLFHMYLAYRLLYMSLIVERRRFNSIGCRVMNPAQQKSPRSRQSGARSSSLGNITSRQSGAGVPVSPVRREKSPFDNRKSHVGRSQDRGQLHVAQVERRMP